MPTTRRLVLAACLALASLPAVAQVPQTRLRGVIAGLDGATLSVVTREGPTVTITLPDGLEPSALKRLSLDAIHPDTFLATVTERDGDGAFRSIYVQILPDSLRATNQLNAPWDLAPGTTMTNAIVSSVVSGKSGRKLDMTYNGTPVEVTVPENVPVIQAIPARRADLVKGARVFIAAEKTGDSTYLARRVTVGKDGIDPPQ